MTDKPNPTPTEQIPAVAMGVSALGSANAPIIFVEGAPCWGYRPGVGWVTLEAVRHHPNETGVLFDRVVVAHLKLDMDAVRALHKAMGAIIDMASKPEGLPN